MPRLDSTGDYAPAPAPDRQCLLDAFEDAHADGAAPDVADWVAGTGSGYYRLLLELIDLSLEIRVRRGDGIDLTHFLDRFPDLADFPNEVMHLIETEVRQRAARAARDLGPDPSPREYAARHPAFAARIEALFRSPGMGRVEVGGYEILEELGQGTFGTVYRAREELLDRVVALKVLKPEHVQGGRLREKFLAEARAMATIHHAGVVQVFATGETPEGRPFLAMEFVEGGTLSALTRDGRTLPPRAAAGMLVEVARGVQAAHERGIVHRDLKPDNVMLTAGGAPKVADFGLAKDIGSGGHEHSQAPAGTPLYMSPEQVLGQSERIGPATDVYALGVILYELLTGQKPFTGASRAELDRKILSDEPPGFRDLNVSLPRDLETVCRKCLMKDPQKRYSTADGFADDLVRWLDGRPILARPVGAPERAWKWYRRNRAVSLAAAGLIVSLAVGAGVSLWQAGIARLAESDAVDARTQESLLREIAQEGQRNAEREQAAAERANRRATESFKKTLAALRATTNEDVARLIGERTVITENERRYIEAIADRWQTFSNRTGDDRESRSMSAEGHFQVGSLLQKLGRRSEAEGHYKQSRQLQMALVDEFPGDSDSCRALSSSSHNLGVLMHEFNRNPEAATELRRAVDLSRMAADADPESEGVRASLANSHCALGNVLAAQLQYESADSEYRAAQSLQKSLVARSPKSTSYRANLASTGTNLGLLLLKMDLPDEAILEYREALKLGQSLTDDLPKDPDAFRLLAKIHTNLGILHYETRDTRRATEHYSAAARIRKDIAARFPNNPDHRNELGISLKHLADLSSRNGDRGSAKKSYEEAIEVQSSVVGQFPEIPMYLEELARTHTRFANSLSDLKEWKKAEAEYGKSQNLRVALAERFPDPKYRHNVARGNHNLALCYLDQKRFEEALKKFEEIVGIEEALLKRHTPEQIEHNSTELNPVVFLGGVCCDIGHIIRDEIDPKASLVWFDKAIATLKPVEGKKLVSGREFLQNSHSGRAMSFDELGRGPEALVDWNRAVLLASKRELPTVRVFRANSLTKGGMLAEAVSEVRELAATIPEWEPIVWYGFARIYAIAGSKMTDKSLEYGGESVRLLIAAAEGGYPNLLESKSDPDFRLLWDRADFKALLVTFDKTPPKKGPRK